MLQNHSSNSSSRVWAEIDLPAISRNFQTIVKKVAPAKVMAVLKANAYGLGAKKIAGALFKAGADRFGVAELKEAYPLMGYGLPIQIIGGLLPDEIPFCVEHEFVCPVGDLKTAEMISKEAMKQGKTVRVHLKIDTGMGRLGFVYSEGVSKLLRVAELPGLEIEGIYSHFPNANNPMHPKSSEQITLFLSILDTLKQKGLEIPLIHMANSDAINNVPDSYFNLVRTGINLYGVFDLEGRKTYDLARTLALRTKLVAKRLLPAGHTIGYGCTHTLFRDTWVGTISAGYADGIPLAASNSGRILVRGKLCPIIGRVSMDYVTVDLSPCPQSQPGDTVTIVGVSESEEITIEDWARIKQTHPYEIICSLGNRVERIYQPIHTQ